MSDTILIDAEAPTALAERKVSMSNALTRAAHGLDIKEKRLIALGLAKTDSVSKKALALATNQGWKLRIAALEYAEEFGVSPSTAYQQLKDASEHLYERTIGFVVKGKQNTQKVRRWRWVSAVEYSEGEGYVQLNFSPEIAPHLLGLSQQFTSYQLRQAAKLDSIYAWRLFECLKSWGNTGRWSPTVEAFHDAMEAPPSCRKDFKALRLRVIEPAIASINAKADMQVEWTPIRHGGRKVSGLQFTVAQQPGLFGQRQSQPDAEA